MALGFPHNVTIKAQWLKTPPDSFHDTGNQSVVEAISPW